MARERNPRWASHRNGTLWVVLPLDGEWDYFVRFDAEAGHPVVAELRVLPRSDTPGVPAHHDEHADRWVLGTLGQTPDVPTPAGGLTSRALRGIHLGRAVDEAYSHVKEWLDRENRHPDSRFPLPFTEAAAREPRRPGRKGRDDRFYVHAAAAYVEAVERGSRTPVVDAADALSRITGGHYGAGYVRDLLHVARQRDLLTRPRRGRAGGRLTQKALDLLEQKEG